MQHIETVELASAANTVEFASIPDTFTDLVVKLSVRSPYAPATIYDVLALQFNGSTTGYSSRVLEGSGSSASSASQTTITAGGLTMGRIGLVNNASSTSNTFSNFEMYVPNYRSSVAKSVSVDAVVENNATTGFQFIRAFLWTGTDPITSIKFGLSSFGTSPDFVANSTFSLYGILAGNDGTTVVS